MIKSNIFPLLGIDYGIKHVGVAISDSKGIIAAPISTIHLPESNKKVFLKHRLTEIIKDFQVKAILLGMPQQFEESISGSVKKIENFAKWLRENFDLEIQFTDEAFSTKIAENMILSKGSNIKSERKKVDSIACAFFLQEFLDNNKKDEKDII